jgi:hypothetical protein
VTGTAASTSTNAGQGTTVSSTATCPSGKVLLGGGGEVTTGQSGRAALLASGPTSTTTWRATAVVTQNLSGGNTATVTAFAICTP